ncbi:hypothetical protein LTR53_004904 [Teratosphaeriaceae sp. CCFEE 6253]|nr:hypothetical protein LTR53_004904 [Teratosphaeriaceae sp. CCFEE 6253]
MLGLSTDAAMRGVTAVRSVDGTRAAMTLAKVNGVVGSLLLVSVEVMKLASGLQASEVLGTVKSFSSNAPVLLPPHAPVVQYKFVWIGDHHPPPQERRRARKKFAELSERIAEIDAQLEDLEGKTKELQDVKDIGQDPSGSQDAADKESEARENEVNKKAR